MTRKNFDKCLELFSESRSHFMYFHDADETCCLYHDEVQDFIWNIVHSDQFVSRYIVEETQRRAEFKAEYERLQEEWNNRPKITNLTEDEMAERDEPFEFMRLEMKKDLTVVEKERFDKLSKIYTNATAKGASFRAVKK